MWDEVRTRAGGGRGGGWGGEGKRQIYGGGTCCWTLAGLSLWPYLWQWSRWDAMLCLEGAKRVHGMTMDTNNTVLLSHSHRVGAPF